MKNLPLILSILALVGVIALLIMNTNTGGGATDQTDSASGTATGETPPIVYVNSDSLLQGYDYFREKAEALAQRERKANQEMQTKSRGLESEVRKIQQQIQQGLLAPNQIAREEQRIAQQQQQLVAEQQQRNQQLMVEGQALQQELDSLVDEVLTDLRDEKGYNFILNYGPSSGVLSVNEELDITAMVLERLNGRRKKKTQTDTTAAE